MGKCFEYTSLYTLREIIFKDSFNVEFKWDGIEFPKQLKEKSEVGKSKYCRFHMSNGHKMED